VGGTPTVSSTVTITGGAKFVPAEDSFTDATYNSSLKVATVAAEADSGLMVEFTSAGQVVVTIDDTTDYSLYFIVQASCGSDWSASKSKAQLRNDTSAADSSVDESAGATVQYDTSLLQKSYLALDMNDSYGNGVDTSDTALIATATGGCTINWDASAVTGTTTAVDTIAASNDTENLVILNDNTPRSCTVTVTFGGTTVATKTVKFVGDVASIAIDPANTKSYFAHGEAGSSSATALNANSITYVVKDSAGNLIIPAAAPSITSTTGGFVQATVADGTYTYADMLVNGFATLDFNASSVDSSLKGAGKYAIKLTRLSDGQTVNSQVVDANINGSIWTYEASWDKAQYKTGEIMTLTLTVKDSGGRLAFDGEDLAGLVVAVGGAETTTAPATTDTILNGKKTWKYIAKTTSGDYGWSVYVTSGSSQANLVGTYKVVDSTTVVSNADVLKSIVALIASINKQIQALQKLILKR
jgi:hypothetical protein